RTNTLFFENSTIDGKVLQEKIQEELTQIDRIGARIAELEAEIADIQSGQHVDIADITLKNTDADATEK
ncbi:hypothetical protein KBI23_25930, partial [bacterium]|nr:hypothetical protein [bacterium]